MATVLIQYETLWLKQFKERIEKATSMNISAPLLRLQETERGGRKSRIMVNSDSG